MVESSESSSVLERVLFSKHTFPSDSSSSSMCRMHSLFNSPPARQQHPHLLSRRQTFPQSTSHTPNLSPSSSTSSMLSLLRLAATATPKESISNGEHMQAPPTPSSTPPNEAAKIQRNSLYLTFNAPRVDDYHRGIFMTNESSPPAPSAMGAGTLFHASYAPLASDPTISTWTMEQRTVGDVTSSASLVLLFRLGTIDSGVIPVEEQLARVSEVLGRIPLGRKEREAEIGPLKLGEGNPVLAGYDCIIWTKDAMTVLAKEGLVDLHGLSSDVMMAKVRAMAGPPDAKSMVGVDFGGFKVYN